MGIFELGNLMPAMASQATVPIPAGFSLTESACDAHITSTLGGYRDALPNQSSLMAQENIDALFVTGIFKTRTNQEGIEERTMAMKMGWGYQTDNHHASGSYSAGDMYQYLIDRSWPEFQLIRHSIANRSLTSWEMQRQYGITPTLIPARNVWIPPGASGTGGGAGGIAALDVPMIAGDIYSGPDTTRQSFDIIYAIQAGFLPAVRPGRNGGIFHHPERYTTFRIMSIDGRSIYATTNIIINSIRKGRQENVNFTQSTEGYVGSFSEEAPEMATVSGEVFDCENFDWKRELEMVYDRLARGSVLAREKWRLYLLYKADIIGGYPLNLQMFEDVLQDPRVPFSFQMYLTDRMPLPKMQAYIDNKNGQTYYRYKGTSETLVQDVEAMADGYLLGLSEYQPGPKDGTAGSSKEVSDEAQALLQAPGPPE